MKSNLKLHFAVTGLNGKVRLKLSDDSCSWDAVCWRSWYACVWCLLTLGCSFLMGADEIQLLIYTVCFVSFFPLWVLICATIVHFSALAWSTSVLCNHCSLICISIVYLSVARECPSAAWYCKVCPSVKRVATVSVGRSLCFSSCTLWHQSWEWFCRLSRHFDDSYTGIVHIGCVIAFHMMLSARNLHHTDFGCNDCGSFLPWMKCWIRLYRCC